MASFPCRTQARDIPSEPISNCLSSEPYLKNRCTSPLSLRKVLNGLCWDNRVSETKKLQYRYPGQTPRNHSFFVLWPRSMLNCVQYARKSSELQFISFFSFSGHLRSISGFREIIPKCKITKKNRDVWQV